jgi:hypothetical protein
MRRLFKDATNLRSASGVRRLTDHAKPVAMVTEVDRVALMVSVRLAEGSTLPGKNRNSGRDSISVAMPSASARSHLSLINN